MQVSSPPRRVRGGGQLSSRSPSPSSSSPPPPHQQHSRPSSSSSSSSSSFSSACFYPPWSLEAGLGPLSAAELAAVAAGKAALVVYALLRWLLVVALGVLPGPGASGRRRRGGSGLLSPSVKRLGGLPSRGAKEVAAAAFSRALVRFFVDRCLFFFRHVFFCAFLRRPLAGLTLFFRVSCRWMGASDSPERPRGEQTSQKKRKGTTRRRHFFAFI